LQHEQVNREAIAITVKASKMTGRVLWAVCRSVGRQIIKQHRAAQTPKGKQSVKKLMNHNEATSTIPLDGDMKLFDRVARKHRVDYSFHKLGKDKYLLLFKAKQTDSITAAFADYSKRMVKRAQEKRPPIMERLKRAIEHAAKQRTQQKQHKRERGAVHSDR